MDRLRDERLLAQALGRMLARSSGARVATLPFGLDEGQAVALVAEANRVRPEVRPAFAILMRDEAAGTEAPHGIVSVGAHEAARYREGDRLLVVHGSQSDLASNTQTFVELLGSSWPEYAEEQVSLGLLAREALSLVLDAGSGPHADMGRKVLLATFTSLASTYKRLGSSTEAWNALWWRHVSMGLTALGEQIRLAPPDADRESFIRIAIPASFGLPQLPHGSHDPMNDLKLSAAWLEHWSGTDTAASSARSLALVAQAGGWQPPGIVNVDFSGLDDCLLRTGNPLAAWAQCVLPDPGAVAALRDLSLDQFLFPYGHEDHAIQVFSNGSSCAREDLVGSIAYVTTVMNGLEIHSQLLDLWLPVGAVAAIGRPTQEEAPFQSALTITPSLRSVRFEGVVVLDGGRPVARGRLITSAKSFQPRVVKIAVGIPTGDSLDGIVPPDAVASVALMHPERPTVSVRELKKANLAARTVIFSVDPGQGETSETLPGTGPHRLIICEPTGLFVPIVQDQEPHEWPGRPGLHFETVPAADITIEIAGATVELRLPDDPKQRRYCPLLALIDNVPVLDGPPPDGARDEIRGAIEDQLARLLTSEEADWASGFGHFVLPAGLGNQDQDFKLADDGVFVTTSSWAPSTWWKNHKLPRVAGSLITSEAARSFREAFRALGIIEELRDGQATGRLWPSRIEMARLWRTGSLAQYLEAYSGLIAESREYDDLAQFWATYPFSCSAWSIDGLAQLEAVLLSPLHPLRLAWLAGVSAGLLEEDDPDSRKRFAGIIEGWNLPYVGPAEVAEGKVIAVPIDNGPEQLFIGWSMMVRTTNALAPLKAPERIGGRRAPGSSISGLNGASAAKAMSDYRGLNPFTSTLTVDLAASSKSPRMESVDRAVIDEIARWTAESEDTLAGGARVWDSLNRIGQPPTDYVARKLGSGTPLTWSRYLPRSSSSKPSNIRILQDAGHNIQVKAEKAEPMGSIGEIPFRRHEVLRAVSDDGSSVDSVPTIREGLGWRPYATALAAAEGVEDQGEQPVVRSALSGAILASDSADWTITGDAMLNPSALANQVSASASNLALWEWRPPFLSSGRGTDDSVLERRPYLSIVRLPRSLTTRVDSLIKHSWGEDFGVTAQSVLGELGARGIGLSSLLAIGGAQARGALGFFTALELLDRAQPGYGEQLVLPIDACDEYLSALSGQMHGLGDKRRADLLLIRISDEEVVLVPIEIKYYGMDTPTSLLPAAGAAALEEPLEQLASSARVLAGLSESGQGPLWSAAFASLVEVGLRLNPRAINDRGWAADRLAQIAMGRVPVRVGHPLLTYFKHGSDTYRATADAPSQVLDIDHHGQFVADPGCVARALFSGGKGSGELLSDWSDLVDWACGWPSSRANNADHEALPATSSVSPKTPGETPESAHHGRHAQHAGSSHVAESANEDAASVGPGEQMLAFADEDSAGGAADQGLPPAPAGPGEPPGIHGDGVRFEVGRLSDTMGSAMADFWPANTALTQLNVGVVGNLGTGKTQLIKSLVANLRATAASRQDNPISVLILDYKGDFIGQDFLDAVGGKVLRPFHLPMNYFELQEPFSSLAAVRKAGSFNDVLNQIFNIGPKQQNTLRRIIVELYKKGQAPTIDEIHREYLEVADYDSVVGVLEGWVLAEVFGRRSDGLVSFPELMSDSVTVLSLLDLGADQNSKNALVAMFLNLYYEYMARLQRWPFQGEDPQLRRLNSFLLVDEATNIMSYNFDALNSLLLQGREFGVGVILSSQYLSHFKSSKVDYAQALRTWFVHSVPNVTAQQLQQLGLPNANEATAKRIVELPTHHALYSSLGVPGRFIEGIPFYKWVQENPRGE